MASLFSLRALRPASDATAAKLNSKAVFRGALAAIAVQIIASIAYASQFGWSKVWTVLGGALIIAAAAYVIGVLFGFLFGLPRTVEESHEVTNVEAGRIRFSEQGSLPKYRTNTNLEQISDWLTKILVGVGLVELAKLPGVLHRLGLWIKPALGDASSSEPFGIGLFAYDLVTGFLAGYLLTRLYMAGALSSVDQAIASSKSGVLSFLRRSESDPQKSPEDPPAGQLLDERKVSELGLLVQKIEEAGDQLDVDGYMRLARQLKRVGRYPEAEQAYLKAARLDPRNPAPLNFAGVLRGKYMGDYLLADRYYREAIERDSSYGSAVYNMACNEMRKGDQGEAIRRLAAAVSLDPKYRRLARRDAGPGEPLEPLKGNQLFWALVGEPATGDGDMEGDEQRKYQRLQREQEGHLSKEEKKPSQPPVISDEAEEDDEDPEDDGSPRKRRNK
ncbi:tetratricopeptide repeat protein [Streptomyces nondiastaticus]|uniref:tetratricopeptide repeat protein n=1 Tax=Streptomyces nondiastaticus TaxID=3154512 RepID=UPI00343F5EB7